MVEAWISCVPLSPKPFPAIFLEAEVLLQARGQTLTQMTAACLIWMMMMVFQILCSQTSLVALSHNPMLAFSHHTVLQVQFLQSGTFLLDMVLRFFQVCSYLGLKTQNPLRLRAI